MSDTTQKNTDLCEPDDLEFWLKRKDELEAEIRYETEFEDKHGPRPAIRPQGGLRIYDVKISRKQWLIDQSAEASERIESLTSLQEAAPGPKEIGFKPETKLSLEEIVKAVMLEADTLYKAILKDLHYKNFAITTASMQEIHDSLMEVLPDLKLSYLSQVPIQTESCILKVNNPGKNFREKMIQLTAMKYGYKISLEKAEDLCRDQNTESP